MNHIEAEIEGWVRARKVVPAMRAIDVFLKAASITVDRKIKATDWLRRLGKIWEAYLVIAPEEFKVRSARLDRSTTKQYLWTARMLNLLGASSYAIEIAEIVRNLNTAEEFRILGNIYLSNFEGKKALECFLKMEELDQNPESYNSKIGRIGTADAFMAEGRVKEAISHLHRIKAKEDEELLKGMLLQAEGEYLARTKHFKPALLILEKAEKYFPLTDTSVDHAFVYKWKAVAHAGLKHDQEAKNLFEGAMTQLRRPQYRPEAWLDCFYWMDQFDLLSPARKKDYFAHPGLCSGFLKRISYPLQFKMGGVSAEIWIDLPSGEWGTDDQTFYFISKEVSLLALLVRAGADGLSIFRILPEIWPGEYSIHGLIRRLHQMKRELEKKFQMSIEVKDHVFRMSQEDIDRVRVEVWNQSPKPSVFQKLNVVISEDIQAHYGIKRTQSHHLVKKWKEKGWVVGEQVGRIVKYTWIKSRPG